MTAREEKMRRYWLVKTEPEVYSIDDLKKDRSTAWTGVRNYQARNYLREMKKGDEVLVYHSNSTPPSIVGVATVKREATADLTQFDKKSDYFDPKASPEAPRWFAPELGYVSTFRAPVYIGTLRDIAALSRMTLLQRNSRLSVQPLTKAEFEIVMELGTSKK